MSINFQGSKRSEIAELEFELNHNKLERRVEAIKKVIAAMTVGKDVSALFFPVLKCVETQNLDLKKLVYLYIINYAKSQPDLAVLAVNTFRKDARERVNPLIRGLAVRTMGCIGVETILDYMCDPLKDSMNDEDPYVRKTAAICVAKLYEISQQRVEEYKFIQKLIEMLSDGNGMVVSNAVAALSDIANTKGKVMKMDQDTLHKLLNAISECAEWGRVYILDFLADNMINNPKDVDEIIQRISPNLAHSNSAVVLSAAKVIIKYLDYVQESEKVRSICRKMAAPLISLMNNDPEIQYIAIRNINLIIQKRPYIIDKEVRVFFCNFQDPLYVKLEKLEILIKLADLKNVDSLLNELKDYAQEIDVVFVRKAISAIGRIAIKLEKAADRCIQALHQLINTKIDYVVQEAIIVIKDIFRKYPNKYESIIKDLCENLKALDNTDARASMIWIIGEYGERIDNAIELMMNFSENFKDEAKKVQLAILNASVKLYLKLEDQAEDLVQEVLKLATDESDNPDLRNRGYIYWRMLSIDPELTKKIVLCEKPTISEDASNIEPQLLDKLINNIGMLSSVYYKPPEGFVKKIRDRINERVDLENDDDIVVLNQLQQQVKDDLDIIDSQGVKRSEYANQQQPGQTYSYLTDLLGVGDSDNAGGGTNLIDDLLGGGPSQQPKPQTNDLDDLLGGGPSQINTTGATSSSLLELDGLNLGGGGVAPSNHVKVPYQTVLSNQKPGANTGQVGLQIEAAFQREQDQIQLELKIQNNSQQLISNCVLKLNQNYYGIELDELLPQSFTVAPGEQKYVKLRCSALKKMGQAPPAKPPIIIQAGINSTLDLFFFDIPMLSHVLFTRQTQQPNVYQLQQLWQSSSSGPENFFNVASLSAQVGDAHAMISRLQDNNVYFMNQGLNDQGFDALYVYAVPEKQDEVVIGEISIGGVGGSVALQARSSQPHMNESVEDQHHIQNQQQQQFNFQQMPNGPQGFGMPDNGMAQFDEEEEKMQQKSNFQRCVYILENERKWFWAFPQIEGVPPSPRGGHSATLIGASILYFGGHYYGGKKTGYVYLNDTHVLDLNSSRWIKPKIQGTPPKPRYGHTAILAGSRIIIFGGKGDKNVGFRDLHALDPVTMTWYQGPEGAGAPLARFGHTANLVQGTKMFVFGGWNGKDYYNDLHILDLEIMAWSRPNTSGPAPSPRQGHASILIGNNLVVHGGFKLKEDQLKTCGLNQGSAVNASYLNDIRVLDTDTYTWSRLRISDEPPEARYGHTLNISGADIIMFGGWTVNSGNRAKHEIKKEQCDYFMIWNTETMSWKKGKYIGNPPTQRYGHTSTAIGPHLLIFGGWEFSKAQNEIIVLREFTQENNGQAINNTLGQTQQSKGSEQHSQKSIKNISDQMRDF